MTEDGSAAAGQACPRGTGARRSLAALLAMAAARTRGGDEAGMGRYMVHMRSGGRGTGARRGHRQRTSQRSPLRQAPPQGWATRRFLTEAAAELCGLS
jgi:hypothetical protein